MNIKEETCTTNQSKINKFSIFSSILRIFKAICEHEVFFQNSNNFGFNIFIVLIKEKNVNKENPKKFFSSGTP